MKSQILHCLLFCALFAPFLAGQNAGGHKPIPDGASADEIYKIIKQERDRSPYYAFDRLAQIGTSKALNKLEDSIDLVAAPYSLMRAYAAFHRFQGDADCETQAWQFVARQASKAKSQAERYAAVVSMVAWGDYAVPTLKSILLNHQDARCRTYAGNALVPILGVQGDAQAAKLILNHVSLNMLRTVYVGSGPAARKLWQGTSTVNHIRMAKSHREVVRSALLACQGPAVLDAYFTKLADKECTSNWKILLIEILGQLPDAEISERLAPMLRDPDASVVALAIQILGQRADWDGFAKRLRGLIKSKDIAVRRASLIALGKINLLEPNWGKQLLKYAQNKDSGIRMGAAVALAELHTPEAIARLHELLNDPEWIVRAEVVQQLGNLRRKQSIPVLITRLGQESGRLQGEIAFVLRMMSGKNLGLTTGSWNWWWETEGDSFKLPPLAEVLAKENKRKAQSDSHRTGASFYGLQVISERVCFILDTSGSMSAPAHSNSRNTAADGKRESTRIEVAKQQLSRIINQIGDGRMFNMIFFDSRIRSWADKLAEMEDSSRKDALAFIKKQKAYGGTALYDAIELAFADPLVDTLFILSDGIPSGGKMIAVNQIRLTVARWNSARKIKINGIAIGMESPLLRWLAEDSGGIYHFEQ
jgi:VWA domain-containing protein/HEAT repeat protein